MQMLFTAVLLNIYFINAKINIYNRTRKKVCQMIDILDVNESEANISSTNYTCYLTKD